MLGLGWYLCVGYFSLFGTDQVGTWLWLSDRTGFIILFTRYSTLRPRCFIINCSLIIGQFMHSRRSVLSMHSYQLPLFSQLLIEANKLFVSVVLTGFSLVFMLSLLLSTILRYYHTIEWVFSAILGDSRSVFLNSFSNEIIKFFFFLIILLESASVASLGAFLDYFQLITRCVVIVKTFNFYSGRLLGLCTLSDLNKYYEQIDELTLIAAEE